MDYGGLGNGFFRGRWVGCPGILEVIKELSTILLSAMSAGKEATELSKISCGGAFRKVFLIYWQICIPECLIQLSLYCMK